eukprot:1161768-Pelagomonas_calceolata.AAC.4
MEGIQSTRLIASMLIRGLQGAYSPRLWLISSWIDYDMKAWHERNKLEHLKTTATEEHIHKPKGPQGRKEEIGAGEEAFRSLRRDFRSFRLDFASFDGLGAMLVFLDIAPSEGHRAIAVTCISYFAFQSERVFRLFSS